MTEQGKKIKAVSKTRVDLTRVLAVATILADRDGLDQLSMRELASALGIQTPSLYTHVTSLKTLHRLLALKGLRALDERITRAALGRSTDDAVRALARAHRQFAHECPGLYMATQPTPPSDDDEWNEVRERIMETILVALEGYHFSEDEAIHIVRGLRSFVHGYVLMEMSNAFKRQMVDRDESFERVLSIFIVGMKSEA